MVECTSRLYFLLIVALCLILHGHANGIRRPNPCISYSNCISPATVPTTRIMTTLFSFNFFRFADDQFMSDICPELEERSSCAELLLQCRNEEWPQTTSFQSSDFELALWVCDNRGRFEANDDCWEDPFLTEMSSCTGLEHFLQPTECLLRKIRDLERCSQQALDLFNDLLSAAHAS